jgi:enoyl-CoA hydratase/carnithine racemase
VSTTRLERRGDVYILFLGDTENRYNPDSLAELNRLVQEVQDAPHPRALVTVGEGKFFSNGLDLDWLKSSGTPLEDLVTPVQELLARILESDFPTVAAIQGHCYAAGAMFALAHDARIMRDDRGFLCFPEVDIKMSFSPGMNALLTAKLAPQTAHLSMALGRRYTGPTAMAAGIVDATSGEAELLDTAVVWAAEYVGKDPTSLAAIKRMLYADTLELLRSQPVLGPGGFSLP